MALRKIIIPVDSILEIFKSYTARTGDIPIDAQPTSLLVNRDHKGMFGIMTDSAEWNGTEPPIYINFDIRRTYGL